MQFLMSKRRGRHWKPINLISAVSDNKYRDILRSDCYIELYRSMNRFLVSLVDGPLNQPSSA